MLILSKNSETHSRQFHPNFTVLNGYIIVPNFIIFGKRDRFEQFMVD